MPKVALIPNGATIVRLRSLRGFTQDEFAKRARCSKRTLERAEDSIPIRPRTLQSIAQALHVGIEDILMAATSKLGDEGTNIDVETYRRIVRKRYNRLKLEELNPTSYDIQPLALTGIFIPQNVRKCHDLPARVLELLREAPERLRASDKIEDTGGNEIVLRHRLRTYLDESPRPILEIIGDPSIEFNRIAILGDPGAGKSTLLQYIVMRWAEGIDSSLQRQALPLLIELREYARFRREGKVYDFLSFLHQRESARWHKDHEQLACWLQQNPSLIMFDGLDEVFDPDLRHEVATGIHRLADEYPLARIIVTSRVVGYRDEVWRDEGFQHFMLQELSETQIEEFLTHWHRNAYTDRNDVNEKRDRLARAIVSVPAIRQLAGNPLLLTMMSMLNRTQELPRDRAELYEQCARLLLYQWKVDLAFTDYPDLAKASLDYKDKRDLLLRVARTIQDCAEEQGSLANLIDENRLEATLEEGLKGYPNLRPQRAARALIEQLRVRNFMLCSAGGGTYAFVHRTFLEYFCALEVYRRFSHDQTLDPRQLTKDVFGRHWQDEAWHETLSLLAGMLSPRFVGEILKFLLERQDPEQTHQHVLLAARCVGEIRRPTELGAIATKVRERIEALVSFGLDSYGGSEDQKGARARSIQAKAVRIRAQVWHDEPDALDWLKTKTASESSRDVRRAAIEEVARGWKSDPNTLPWLKAIAESGDDSEAQAAAIEEVARGWKDDPNTLSWIRALAQRDDESMAQGMAITQLARHWRDDPETLPVIMSRVAPDEHSESDISYAALRELENGWPDNAQVREFVKSYGKRRGRRG